MEEEESSVYTEELRRVAMLTGGLVHDLDVEAWSFGVRVSDLRRARSTPDDNVPPNLDYVVRRIVERSMAASLRPTAPPPPSRVYHTDECPVCTGTERLAVLECGHVVCRACHAAIRARAPTCPCPQCRTPSRRLWDINDVQGA